MDFRGELSETQFFTKILKIFYRYLVDEMMNPVLSKTFCGSLQYASPEIIKGTPYNPKLSDVWAFGVVIYTMLNKSMPFDDDNAKVK